jgi:hypothetical protein
MSIGGALIVGGASTAPSQTSPEDSIAAAKPPLETWIVASRIGSP